MKIDDAIFSITIEDKRLGTCFAVEIDGYELIITCAHIFCSIDKLHEKEFTIHDSKHLFYASIIDISETDDIAILISTKKLKCSKLYLVSNDFIKSTMELGIYGYTLEDTDFSGTYIDGLLYKASVPGNKLRIKIPDESTNMIKNGISGSPLMWNVDGAATSVFGMLHSSSPNEGIFISSTLISTFIKNSEKIKMRQPDFKNGSIPTIKGVWEFKLNDLNSLLNIKDLKLHSRGLIYLYQNGDIINGSAVNTLFTDLIGDEPFSVFVYDIIKARIVEEQFWTVWLTATCNLVSRTFIQKGKNKQINNSIRHIGESFPRIVTMELFVSINIKQGEGNGFWNIPQTSRKGDINLRTYRYKFFLPSANNIRIKEKIFVSELKRTIDENDRFIDDTKGTRYHVILDHDFKIIGQCRTTPYNSLKLELREHYSVLHPESCSYISKLCVLKKHRNRGFDRRLCANVVKSLYNEGYKEIALNCCKIHVPIYNYLGFRMCGDSFFCNEVKDYVYPFKCEINKIINHKILLRYLS